MAWVLLLVLTSCTSSTPPLEDQATPKPSLLNQSALITPTPSALRFRVAVTQPPAVSGYLLPYWVGFESGLFRKEGLALELVTLQSEQLAISAAVNGEVDLIVASPSPVILAAAATGGDTIIVGATHNGFDQRLIAATDITTPDELVGKAAIVNARATLNDFQTREALRRVGIDPETQLAGYWTGPNQTERIQHLKLGNGQMIALAPPLSTLLVQEGYHDFGDLSAGPPWPGAALWVSKRWYISRFAYMERFVQGLAASIARTKSDPELAKQVLAKYMQVTDSEALDEAYAVYGDRLLERLPRINRDGLQRAVDFAAQARPGLPLPRTSGMVDEALVERLQTSGQLDQLYR